MSDGYGAACAPMTLEIPDDMATTRDLLDAAARWVAEHKGMSPRAAKAYVHAMPLGELVNLPPVRRLLYAAAKANLERAS